MSNSISKLHNFSIYTFAQRQYSIISPNKTKHSPASSLTTFVCSTPLTYKSEFIHRANNTGHLLFLYTYLVMLITKLDAPHSRSITIGSCTGKFLFQEASANRTF